jgi:hypothetical protein
MEALQLGAQGDACDGFAVGAQIFDGVLDFGVGEAGRAGHVLIITENNGNTSDLCGPSGPWRLGNLGRLGVKRLNRIGIIFFIVPRNCSTAGLPTIADFGAGLTARVPVLAAGIPEWSWLGRLPSIPSIGPRASRCRSLLAAPAGVAVAGQAPRNGRSES